MDKLTAIKIKYEDGTYSDEIPVSVLSENVEWDNTHTLVDVLGSINVDVTGTIQDQISRLFNEKVNSSEIAVLKSRINNLIKLKSGSTTGDAELADIRVGADGTVYDNAGDAVRQQAGALKSDIANFGEYGGLVHNWVNGKIIYTNTDIVDLAEHTSSSGKYAIIECASGSQFTLYGTGFASALLWCFTDANYNRLSYSASSATLKNEVITAPEGSAYLIINTTKSGVCCKGLYLNDIITKEYNNTIRPKLLLESDCVSYRQFGAVLDGVTDDSNSVIACHEFANTYGKKVVEHGGKLLCNFTVKVKTNCELDLEFIINDDTPLTVYDIVSDTVIDDFLYQKTFKTNQGIISDDERLLGKFFVPNREGKNFAEWYLGRRYPSNSEEEYYHRQPICVDNIGKIITSPIFFHCDGRPTIKECKELSEKGIIFSGGKVNTNLSKIGFPRFVRCQRNNCTIKNIFINNESLPIDSANYPAGLINVLNCCNIVIENIVGLNNSVDLITKHSYIIDITDCYNITIRNCNISQGWGVMATHFCDTVNVYDCIINRVDNHYGCFGQWVVRDCIIANDISIGYGNADFTIDNVTFIHHDQETISPYAIYTRADFNVNYGGVLKINNVKLVGNYTCLLKWQIGSQLEGYEAYKYLQRSTGSVCISNSDIGANTALYNVTDIEIPLSLSNVVCRPFTSGTISVLNAYNSSLYAVYGASEKYLNGCIINSLREIEGATNGKINAMNCVIKGTFELLETDLKVINSIFEIPSNSEVKCKSITLFGCFADENINIVSDNKNVINCTNIS